MIRGKLVFKSNGFNKTGFMNFLKVKSQLILGQNSGHTGGSFFFTRIVSPTIPKFRIYRRVFLV